MVQTSTLPFRKTGDNGDVPLLSGAWGPWQERRHIKFKDLPEEEMRQRGLQIPIICRLTLQISSI
jgi:hypothetical protein